MCDVIVYISIYILYIYAERRRLMRIRRSHNITKPGVKKCSFFLFFKKSFYFFFYFTSLSRIYISYIQSLSFSSFLFIFIIPLLLVFTFLPSFSYFTLILFDLSIIRLSFQDRNPRFSL